MGLLFIHPPQEYWKKSTQGSTLRSIEVTSRAGAYFDAVGAGACCALAIATRATLTSAIMSVRRSAMKDLSVGIEPLESIEYKASHPISFHVGAQKLRKLQA